MFVSGADSHCCLTLYLGGFYPSPACVRKWYLSSKSSFLFSVLSRHLCLSVLLKRESIRVYCLPWVLEGCRCCRQVELTGFSPGRGGAPAASEATGAADAALHAPRAPGQRPARRAHRLRLHRPGTQLPPGLPDARRLPGEHTLLQMER